MAQIPERFRIRMAENNTDQVLRLVGRVCKESMIPRIESWRGLKFATIVCMGDTCDCRRGPISTLRKGRLVIDEVYLAWACEHCIHYDDYVPVYVTVYVRKDTLENP